MGTPTVILLSRRSTHTASTRGYNLKTSHNTTVFYSAIVLFSAMTLAIIVGCSRKDAGTTTASQGAPAQAAAPESASPQAAPTGQTATGTVAETMDSAGYTYVKVKTDAGDIWAATSQFKIKVGERVMVPLGMGMTNFHSATLNRTFPTIYFTPQITKQS